LDPFEKLVRIYIRDLGLHDKIALLDYLVAAIKKDLKETRPHEKQ